MRVLVSKYYIILSSKEQQLTVCVNAGMSRNDASLFSGNTSSWVEMVSTNILGTCMCTREVLQDMKRRNSYGHIINMVGLSGHRIPDGPAGGGFFAGERGSAVSAAAR